MSEERIQILKMLEDGKISAEEALKLLDTVESEPRPGPTPKRTIRVRVVDGESDRVNVTLPVNLAKVAVGLATRFDKRMEKVDFDRILREVEQGTEGKIVEVVEGARRVEVYIE